MDELISIFEKKLQHTDTSFVRDSMHTINWQARLIGIKGARGVGKTTLLLQHIKLHLAKELDRVLYVSLDNVWFNSNSLISLVREFEQRGGKHLFLDEVHKYPAWSQAIKNLYDDYPSLKIVFTGSSLLEILNARADLSRRAIIYHLHGLSFREYLTLETGSDFKRISVADLIKEHTDFAREVNDRIKPFQYFGKYLEHGYYPYYREIQDLYFVRLGEVVNMMLEVELPLLRNISVASIIKIKQLLGIVAASVPFQPNVSKLSEKTDIARNTLLSFLHYLDEIGLTRNLFKDSHGISLLQKPMKIYLENTNLMYLLARNNVNPGNLRETFFASQVGANHQLSYSETGDFVVDNQYVFEVGGTGKTSRQIKNIPNAFLAVDGITHGSHNRIPLWAFGFLY